MFKHYFRITIRNINKRKMLSFVQIFGFALGISAFMLITKYIDYETGWDKFNENFDRIYRVQLVHKKDKTDIEDQTSSALSGFFSNNMPAVETFTTLKNINGEYLSSAIGEVPFFEENGMFASSEVFSVFSYKLISGDSLHLLDQPNSIVLSQAMAEKYFPNETEIIGRSIFDNQKNELLVTGVMKNIREDSHIRPDYFRSIVPSLFAQADWSKNDCFNYVILKQGIKKENVDTQIKHLLDKHIDENEFDLFLHPLQKLHFQPLSATNPFGDIVFFNSLLGMLILLLALVNFANLSSAFSLMRLTEIGVRKTSGSGKKHIVAQFLSESLVLSLIAFTLAIGISFIGLPYFNLVVNREINFSLISDAGLIVKVLLVVSAVGLLAGAFPTYIASRLNPVSILKSKPTFRGKQGRLNFMSIMVYFQFVLSALLISSSVWTFKQVDFIINTNLGFNTDSLLYCRIEAKNQIQTFETLSNKILEYPGINSVTVSNNTPLHNESERKVSYEGGGVKEKANVKHNSASNEFLKTFGIKLIQGREFSKERIADKYSCIINEAAVKRFGWMDPIGKWVEMGEKQFQVIGVMKDFHYSGVHRRIKPYLLTLHDGNLNGLNEFTFCINTGDFNKASEHINRVLGESFLNSLYAVSAYNDNADRTDIKTWSTVRNTCVFFTIIAMIIAIVGIFGLVVFTTQRQIKEIGIRKVYGATMSQVLVLVLNKYMVLLAFANLNAIPVNSVLIKHTPGLFKYHSNIGDVMLVLILTFLIVLIAGGYVGYKVARWNPVEALRYE